MVLAGRPTILPSQWMLLCHRLPLAFAPRHATSATITTTATSTTTRSRCRRYGNWIQRVPAHTTTNKNNNSNRVIDGCPRRRAYGSNSWSDSPTTMGLLFFQGTYQLCPPSLTYHHCCRKRALNTLGRLSSSQQQSWYCPYQVSHARLSSRSDNTLIGATTRAGSSRNDPAIPDAMNETRISSSEKNTATKRTISSNISSDGVELFRKTSERIGSLSSSESDWTHDEREAMTAWRLFEAAIHNKETIESYGLLILHHQQQAGTPPPQTTGTTTAPIIYYTQRLAQVLDCFQTLAWWESSIEAERHYCLLVSDAVQKNLAQHNQPTNALNANHQALLLTAESLYYQGRYHVYLSRPTEAGKAYSRALELLELLQQQKWNDIQEGNGNEKDDLTTDMFFGECIRGDVLVALSGLHFHEKEFDKAIEILSQAELEYSSKNTLPIIIGEAAMHKQHRLVRCLQQQGLVYRTLEKYELALQVYQRAVVELNISGRKAAQMGNSSPWFSFRRQVSLEDNSTETTALELKLDQADMHMALDQYDTALEMYESLLYSDRSATTQDLYACVDDDTDPTAKETDDDLTTAILWHNIGKIHAQNGQCGLAVSCLKRSLRVKRRVLDAWHHPELAKTLHALGSVHAILHDKGKAMACFREAMLMARARVPIGDSPDRDPHVIQAMYNLTLLERGSPA